MAGRKFFVMREPSEQWYTELLSDHLEEADQRVQEILEATTTNENGCMVTATKEPRKVRVRGGQDRAYRFVYCITRRIALPRDLVVRHRCHNRVCVNPEHLVEGTRADNARDERERRGHGVAFEFL